MWRTGPVYAGQHVPLLDVIVLTDTKTCSVTNKKGAIMRRHKVAKRKSKKLFKRTAARTHKKNMPRLSMRGGIRL